MAPPLDPIASLRAALRGHYEIEREIGQGAFATVYLARDLKHERKVALKVLNADPTSETGELRFVREIRTLARLQHPNILPLHDSGHVEALLYYVMPYVSGDTLRDRIDREKQMAVDTACNIARDVADALAYAHAQGVIHRDIKPDNILLSTGHPILADFGIARAIDLAGVRQLTRTGSGSPGTPAYMSPEQLIGDKEIDGRSDIYSLGCVLFEMLTGKPPFTGKEGFVKRFTEPPPAASQMRKDLPDWVDEAIAGALQRAPQDRYPTAKEFFVALRAPDTSGESIRVSDPTKRRAAAGAHFQTRAVLSDPPRNEIAPSARPLGEGAASGAVSADDNRRPQRTLSERIRSHPKIVAGLVVGVLAAALALGSPGRRPRLLSALGGGAVMDTARFAVLPFAGPGQLGTHVEGAFYDAFTVWEGLPLVPDTKVAQAIAEQGLPATESQAMELGKQLGAGKVIWGTASGSAGSVRVRVHLYDVKSRESKDDFVFDEANSTGNNYSLAANRLLGVPDRPSAAEGCDDRTRSFAAWSACGRAHVALKNWDISDAERQFRGAIAADADYATPRLWLAQILSWQGFDTRGEWRDQIARAIAQQASLSPRDATLATALSALAVGQFPEACQAYTTLARSSQRDFVAWFGLGECQARDSLVINSRGSPSGWQFRGSYDAAAKSYMRAVRIEPGAYALLSFDRMQVLLPTAPVQIRMGHGEPPERRMYAAYPSLTRDTLSFVPYTFAAFAKLSANEIATQRNALEHNSDVLLDFALNWTQQSTEDPAAFEALADVLETRGQLSDGTGTIPSALTAIHRARELARDPHQSVRDRAREVSIRFKRSEFAIARLLADSVLADVSDSGQTDLRLLGGLAGLTGKLARATVLARLSGVYLPASGLDVPTSLSAPAAAFFANAALGVCGPATDKIEQELDRDISSAFSEDDRERARAELKSRPVSLLAPCTNGVASLKIPTTTDKTLRMQQALARGDSRLLKVLLDSATAVTRTQRPSDLSVDYTYQLAWIRVASGDTASAIQHLDIALGALPSLSSRSLRDIAPAAAAVRAMALRAELAATQKDPQTARRWASAVVALWGGADSPLQPLVGRMRSLASVTNRK